MAVFAVPVTDEAPAMEFLGAAAPGKQKLKESWEEIQAILPCEGKAKKPVPLHQQFGLRVQPGLDCLPEVAKHPVTRLFRIDMPYG